MNDAVAAHPAPRCATGVPGLDEILMGGLPGQRFYLVEGGPGVGKTTLGLQFLLEGARQGENCMYITLSETRDELTAVAHSYGWSLDKLTVFELSALESFLGEDAQNTIFHPAEVELGQVTKILLDEIGRVKPDRLVFDSLSELRLLSQNPLRFRRQLLALKQFFAGSQCTIMMLDGRNQGIEDNEVQSLAHGVIWLEQKAPLYGPERRRLRVLKLRGSGFWGGWHDCRITGNGITVYPRLILDERLHDAQAVELSSGIKNLDALIGGGLNAGTSALFLGPPGTGKSTLSACYAAAAAARGENGIVCTFDEKMDLYVQRADAMGLGLGQWIKKGVVRPHEVNLAAQTPGEFAANIRRDVEERNVRLVVLDSLNGYLKAMPEERLLSVQLHELIKFLSDRGVVTILILTQQGVLGTRQSSVDITYLADTVLVFRYFEINGTYKQAVSVIKKRSGNHERALREFKLGGGGIQVGPPLPDFQGVLAAVPKFTGEDNAMLSDEPDA